MLFATRRNVRLATLDHYLGLSRNLSSLLLSAAGLAAKQNYSDMDIIHFLTNVECLEGQFDTWGTFG